MNDDDDDGDHFNDRGIPGNQVELTHFGQSLSQIEKFERVDLSDDDDEDNQDPNDVDKGKLSGMNFHNTIAKILLNFISNFLIAKVVSENFFGGFKEKDEFDPRKGRKEWIEEMIMKSKQIKVCRYLVYLILFGNLKWLLFFN